MSFLTRDVRQALRSLIRTPAFTVPLRRLFEEPTVAGLAARLEAAASGSAPEVRANGDRNEAPAHPSR